MSSNDETKFDLIVAYPYPLSSLTRHTRTAKPRQDFFPQNASPSSCITDKNTHHSPQHEQVTHNASPLTQPPRPLLAPTPRLPRTLPGLYKSRPIHSANRFLLHYSSAVLSPRQQPQQRRLRTAPDWCAPTVIGVERTSSAARTRPEEEGSSHSRQGPWLMGLFQSAEDGAEYAGGGSFAWYFIPIITSFDTCESQADPSGILLTYHAPTPKAVLGLSKSCAISPGKTYTVSGGSACGSATG